MTHYDERHLTVRWDDSLDAVVMEWHDFAEGDPYREGLNAGLELVEQKGADNWLADLREMGTVADADQEWSNEVWFPRAIESPLSNMAIIQPESVVADMDVENIMQEVGDGALTTKYFDNRPDAESWLEGQAAPV
jgi:hypothetical protein